MTRPVTRAFFLSELPLLFFFLPQSRAQSPPPAEARKDVDKHSDKRGRGESPRRRGSPPRKDRRRGRYAPVSRVWPYGGLCGGVGRIVGRWLRGDRMPILGPVGLLVLFDGPCREC